MNCGHLSCLILGFLIGMAPHTIKLLTKRYNGIDPVETAIMEEAIRTLNRTENKDENK